MMDDFVKMNLIFQQIFKNDNYLALNKYLPQQISHVRKTVPNNFLIFLKLFGKLSHPGESKKNKLIFSYVHFFKFVILKIGKIHFCVCMTAFLLFFLNSSIGKAKSVISLLHVTKQIPELSTIS
jgi:hypothetical protein